jgi:hypothetical protein
LLKKDVNRYSVVPPELVKNLAAARGQVSDNLKWQGLATYDDTAVQGYLERVLLPAFQAIVAAGASRYRFVATYPLAFDRERKQRFVNALKKVLDIIDAATNLSRADFHLISESHAGTHDVAALQATHWLTIDLGGGTTDLALIKMEQSKSPSVLMAESLRIGGRDLIRAALGDRTDLPQRLARVLNVPIEDLSVSPEVAIEGLLASQDGAVQLLLGGDSVSRRQRIAALLSGIVVATARLVFAALGHDGKRDSPPSINVVLLGQGWHLLHDDLLREPFSEASFLDNLQKRAAQFVNFQPVADVRSSADRKLRLVRGALGLASGGTTDQGRPAVSYAGMDLTFADGRTVDISSPLGSIPTTNYSEGDPGVTAVIDDLVATMKTFDSPHRTIGDPDRRLSAVQARMSLKDGLIRDGNLDLTKCRQDDQMVRSPLMAVIEGSWVRYWCPRDE